MIAITEKDVIIVAGGSCSQDVNSNAIEKSGTPESKGGHGSMFEIDYKWKENQTTAFPADDTLNEIMT
ncbi:hypothetical protein HGB13_00330 [bacterium]|nr:hypothetical protein [bacterium]